MRSIIFGTLAFISLTSFSCSKQFTGEPMKVIRDCTGTYLRSDGKDYHVCNINKTKSFTDGASVSAIFKKADECRSLDNQIVCMMLHENQGWIEVTQIK